MAHEHSHNSKHGHSHGIVDPEILRSRAGVKATSLGFLVLMLTAIFQIFVYSYGNSVALLADLIHNAGDALTAIPMGLAFFFRSKKAEHWSGYFVVFLIFVSACIVLYEAFGRLVDPQTPEHLWAILIAGVVGVVGNELAAVIRRRAGKKLHSTALIADANHAHTDALVSVGVIVSAILVSVGLQIADPLIGLFVGMLILRITWQSWLTIRKAA